MKVNYQCYNPVTLLLSSAILLYGQQLITDIYYAQNAIHSIFFRYLTLANINDSLEKRLSVAESNLQLLEEKLKNEKEINLKITKDFERFVLI